ncbi:glycosyltransferase involved in cell wall biosynthesis [Acinetobacter calcoaceticus]|uniref:Glycosyltransferase involved in cell wall biosynthesis n=1 Tax=Acinetobacter calcoaceticus TaxID=471 RepID=A0A4R1XMX4_ACICA|nr:glycosyltransferase involved in cell wall biosynthesis [Acinetobacter calcoaceticus]
MKILYVITGLGGGGAEKVVADMADQMYQRGHQVKIAYLKGEIVVRPKHHEIELIYLGLEGLNCFKHAYMNYKLLIQKFSPDVLHAHMVHANIFSRLSRVFCPVRKLICTAHSNNEGGKLRMLAYKLTHSQADLTTNVSYSASKCFEELGAVPRNGIKTIYNGIDLLRFNNKVATLDKKEKLNIDPITKMFLAVGRFHQAKDYPNLILAFSILKNTLKPAVLPKLYIAGDGELKNTINTMIIEHDLAQDVILLGRRDDIPSLLVAADVFILSSSFEGFGLVVAEAMACETFVIATDSGGVKEVMGGYGLLVAPEESWALANAMNEVLKMDQLEIQQNNSNALNHVRQNFDLEMIIDQWLEIYAEN